MKINETPKRTCRQFNINNIKIENDLIKEELKPFKNIETTIESSKDSIETFEGDLDLRFGLHSNLTYQKSNYEAKITVNSKMKNAIIINFNFDKNNSELAERLYIDAKSDTKSTIIIKYASKEDLDFFHNGVIKVRADHFAEVNIIFANLLNTKSNNFIAIENELQADSKLNSCIIDLGGKLSITNYYSNIIGKNASNNLNTIYLGKEEQVFDLNYIAELYGENSNVNFEVQGALKDSSKKHFKGTIDFKRGAKKAKGDENEACMLLSDKARSLALPMLLCSEEDVEGNHSTSSGKVGDKELFYIMSRGFDEKSAMKLMVRAKFNKILETIKNEELKNEILFEIDKRLD